MKYLANMRYVAVFAWVMTFYFLATGVHDWKLWVAVSLAFIERVLLALLLFITMKLIQRQVTAQIEALQKGLSGNEH